MGRTPGRVEVEVGRIKAVFVTTWAVKHLGSETIGHLVTNASMKLILVIQIMRHYSYDVTFWLQTQKTFQWKPRTYIY